MERKEAIEVVKKNYPHVNVSGSQFETALRTLIPELKESEDERIVKELLTFFRESIHGGHILTNKEYDSWIAWLEKQGKKTKPIEGFNTEFERQVSCVIASAMNKDYEYTKDFVKWTSEGLLNYAKREFEKNSMGISEATKQKLEDNLNKALEKETPESWNKFLDEQGEQKEYTFKSLPRLLDMIEPTDRAKVYCQKLIDTLVKEGYSTDAKIVGECLKKMNGEDVPMAIMDEKQGKNAYNKELSELLHKVICRFINDPDIPYSDREKVSMKVLPYVERLERQDRQKSFDYENANIQQKDFAPKVEPKFKVGDFIVNDYCMGKVIELTNDAYLLDTGQGIPFSCEHNAHIWDISKDAKPGDVLCSESGWTCIFKALDNHTNTFSSYCFMDSDKWFCNTGSEGHTLDKAFIKAYNGNIYPATKEQRDLLFQKMKESSYDWDAEKKEMKKIEQKQVIDYPDNFPKDNWELIHEFVNKFGRIPKDEDELNVLMEYVLKRQRSTWGEDDERLIEEASEYLRKYADHHVQGGNSKVYVHSIADGLESLRPQSTWKPSDDEMKALADALSLAKNCGEECAFALRTLYEQLKKLKG